MKKIVSLLAITLLLGLAVLLSACGGGDDLSSGSTATKVAAGDTTSDENQIRSKIDKAFAAIRSEDWSALYGLASQADRSVCSESDFVDHYNSVAAPSGRSYSKVGVRITSVRVNGDTASVSYYNTYDGTDNGSSNTDLWVKRDGEWYNEGDGSSPTDCGF